jgi:hypothetical protein
VDARQHLAIAEMVAALKAAVADSAPGSECQRLLEECLQMVDAVGADETSERALRVARSRTAAQTLRQASLKPGCQQQPSMEHARRAMTGMLFAITQPP